MKGDFATAVAAYRALAEDPDRDIRAEARFRHARLLLARGEHNAAAILLRQLLDEAPSATVARLELAGILDRLGDREAAFRELRAAQAAGLPTAVARLVDRYSDALRASRPQGASLEIAVAPDSNINRSTRSSTLGTIIGDFEITESSKAKSGIGLALRGTGYRRFSFGEHGMSLLARAAGSADLYGKSRFNDIALDMAVGPELRLGRNRINMEAGSTFRWHGQKPFLRSARLAGSWARPIDGQTQLRLGGSASLIDNLVNDLQDGRSLAMQGSIERAISPTTGVAITGAAERMAARDPGYSTTGWRAGMLVWRDFGRSTMTAGIELGRLRADERLALFPEPRVDRYSRLSLGATFRKHSIGSFAPVVRVSAERNRSTIEFYDYSRRKTEFGLVRAF